MGKRKTPPGFRFHPTDEELVVYYLKRKVMRKKIYQVISELEIYKFVPQDLPDKSSLGSGDLEWYFFCPRERKYASGGRKKRTTESGYWKITGNDKKVESKDRTVGQRRTLIFHQGRAPRGERTNWVMHEYRLEDEDLANKGIAQDAFVLCKIFQKSGLGPKNGAEYGAPFNEEEWDSENEDYQMGSFPCSCSSAVVLSDNQSSSIIGLVGPGDMSCGFPSNSGPSQTLPSAGEMLPSVPDDKPELQPDDELPPASELLSMLKEFDFNQNAENEVDSLSHAHNLENPLPMEGDDDTFENLKDLFNLDNHAFLELDDLNGPLNSGKTGFFQPGDYFYPGNNFEYFDPQFNESCVGHASTSNPCTPVLEDMSYGFENRKDPFPKEYVRANVKQGYELVSYSTKPPEPDTGHGDQTQKRGEQIRSYSRFQQLIESIPSQPASAAEHPGLSKSTIAVLCPSVGVGGCKEEGQSVKLENLSGRGYCGCSCHLHRRRKEASSARWDGNFMFVLFLGLLSALMWVFLAAIILKLGRSALDLLLP